MQGKQTLAGRKLYAIRVRPETMAKFEQLVAGQQYLAIEWALRYVIDDLSKRAPNDIKFVDVENL